jgi:ribosomal protein S18 acetylase RimI-like enzyme
MSAAHPAPTGHVRAARPEDLADLAAVHAAALHHDYARLLPREMLAEVSARQLAERWRSALEPRQHPGDVVLIAVEPPEETDPRFRTPPDPDTPAHAHAHAVVKTSSARTGLPVAGFAAVDRDGEIVALWVHPHRQRRGHGSRLLAAIADHGRRRGVSRLGVWCPAADAARQRFFTSAGFAPDAGRRTLLPEGPGQPLDEVHLSAGLTT